MIGRIAILAGLSIMTFEAHAADIYLICDVTSSRKDGTQSSYQLRYDVTVDTKGVRISQNRGTGVC